MIQSVSLVKAMRSPENFGNISKSYLNYSPDTEIVELYGIPGTALTRTQVFLTKDDKVGWRPWVRYGKGGELYRLYAVATKPVENVAFARNENGWQKVQEMYLHVSKAFGNKYLNAKGLPLTIKMFEAMPEELKAAAEGCWILKHPNYRVKENSDLHFIRKGNVESMATYYSYGGTCCASRGILPIIELPTNILVQVGSKTRNGKKIENALKLQLPEVA